MTPGDGTPAFTSQLRLVAVPENRSARRAVQWLAHRLLQGRARSAFFAPLYLHSPPGTGKSLLCDRLQERVARSGSLTLERISAHDLGRLQVEPGDLQERLERDLWILEDIQHLPPWSFESVCQLLDARRRMQRPSLITGESGPANLPEFPRRLTSRLSSGLVLGLEPFSLPSRLKILTRLAAEKKVPLEPAALRHLATHIPGPGARPLVGAIDTLKAIATPTPVPLSAKRVKSLLAQSLTRDSRNVDAIIQSVAAGFQVKSREMLGDSRLPMLVRPRQVAMFLIRKEGRLSLAKIGSIFHRDPTTVRHAIEKIEADLKNDVHLSALIQQLQSERL